MVTSSATTVTCVNDVSASCVQLCTTAEMPAVTHTFETTKPHHVTGFTVNGGSGERTFLKLASKVLHKVYMYLNVYFMQNF